MTHRNKKILSYILSGAVIVGAGFWVLSRFARMAGVEYTDNAHVCRQIVPVNCRVRGYINEIRFEEFQPVHKGDTLIVIDDSELRLNVARAQADLQNALASRTVADSDVALSMSNVAVSEASIAEAKVLADLAAAELSRHEKLLESEAVTVQQYDAAKADYEAKAARCEMLKRQRTAAADMADVSRSKVSNAVAAIDIARAMLATAELDLSYSVIVAPCDGYASRKEVQVGQLVQPGQTLLDIVDTGELWVTANYKETQLSHIDVGSPVRIEVDAFPDIKFRGEVKSISTATGASLSLIPQDNSAGNFVKVRQRIPVRIEFTTDNDAADISRLRAGMNVECSVEY